MRTLLTLLLVMMLAACSEKPHTPKPPKPVVSNSSKIKIKSGDYFRESYLNSLEKTRSPLASFGEGGLLEVKLSYKPEGLIFFGIWNFHEGDMDRIVASDGTTKRTDLASDEQPIRIKIESSKTFSIASPKESAGRFVKLDHFENWLRQHTIAGNFTDDQGRHYRFNSDGKAEFPDRQFTYEIGSDQVGLNSNYLVSNHDFWGFEWQGNDLLLFEMEDSEPFEKDNKPFLRLHRQTG